MMKCSPEAFVQCPTSQYCGNSPAECEFVEGSDCDKFNQEIQSKQTIGLRSGIMPDMRKKLIKLIKYCTSCEECRDEDIADHLIANGVTVQEWISVKDRLPEEHDSIWAKLYGTKSWQPGLFRKCSYDVNACVEKKDGRRRVVSIRTYDGKWDYQKLNEETVVCWQPMPQPPREVQK